MYFDRFDIVEAYYLFFSQYHEGLWSKNYSRLSKIVTYFKPKVQLHIENLTENGLAIYTQLKRKDRELNS